MLVNCYCVCLIKWRGRDTWHFVMDYATYPNPDKDSRGPSEARERAARLRRLFGAVSETDEVEAARRLRKRLGIPMEVTVYVEPVLLTGLEGS